jgi:hypothetical protein
MKAAGRAVLFAALDLLAACGSTPLASGPPPTPDAASADAPAIDAQTVDEGIDEGIDAGIDQGVEAPAGDAGGSTAPGTPYRALSVAVGRYHTCAILDDHGVKCWGYNHYGQLGLGDDENRGLTPAEMGDALPKVDLGAGRTAKAIAAAHYATCAILDDDTVKCWGWSAQTGLPVDATLGARGDQPGEMGDDLPRLDLRGRKARRLAMGYGSACAELDDGALRCWADAGSFGDVPRAAGDTIAALAGTKVVGVLYTDGHVDAFGAGGVERPSEFVDIAPLRAIAIGGSYDQACAVLEDGRIKCRSDHVFPTTTPLNVAVAISEVGRVCALRADGRVACADGTAPAWGTGEDIDGAAIVALGQPAVALGGAGYDHDCALLSDGGIKCWRDFSTGPDVLGVLGASVPTGDYGDGWREIDLGTHGGP